MLRTKEKVEFFVFGIAQMRSPMRKRLRCGWTATVLPHGLYICHQGVVYT